MPFAEPIAVGHEQTYGAEVKLQTLAMAPPIFRIRGFLTPLERSHLVAQAELLNIASPMAQSWTSGGIDSKQRTSHTVWLGSHYGVEHDEQPTTPLMRRIIQRAARVLKVDESLVEGIQVTRYHQSSEYKHHTDFRQPEVSVRDFNGFNRFATLLVYLNDARHAVGRAHEKLTSGGETHFPLADTPEPEEDVYPDCSIPGLKVKPVAGDALL